MSALFRRKRKIGLALFAAVTAIILALGVNAGTASATSGGSTSNTASATSGGSNNGNLVQVFCNQEGNSGKWKAQIGGPSTEHEIALKDANGNDVFVQSESDVTAAMSADCQAQNGRTAVTAVDGQFFDFCGAEYNLQFRSAVTEGVAYLENRVGNTLTVTAVVTDDTKYVLTNPDWSQSMTDSLTPCPSTKTEVTAVNGTFNDSCGTTYNLSFTPAVTEGVRYVETREGNTLTVRAVVTDDSQYVLTNPDWSQSMTDALTPCPPPPPTVIPTPQIMLTPVCGLGNDVVTYVDSPYYWSGEATYRDGKYYETFTVKTGVDMVFPNGLRTITVSRDEIDTSPCPSTKTEVTAVNGTFNDSCGTTYNLSFTPAVTEGVRYVETREGNTLTVRAVVTDDSQYVLTNPDWSQSMTDALTPCPPKKLGGVTVTGACGYVQVTDAASTDGKPNPAVTVPYGDFKMPQPDGVATVQPGQTVKIATKRTSLDLLAYADGYTTLEFHGVAVDQKCAVTPPPPAHKPPVVHHKPVTGVPASTHKSTWTPPQVQHVVPGSGAPHTGGAGNSDPRNLEAALAFLGMAIVAGGAARRRRQRTTV